MHDILPDLPTRYTDAYSLELEDFFRVVMERGVTVEDGVKALEVAYAATEAFKSGQKIDLSSKGTMQ
jgi:scyllo-inositol 2-dehydrogenase (NAD+)